MSGLKGAPVKLLLCFIAPEHFLHLYSPLPSFLSHNPSVVLKYSETEVVSIKNPYFGTFLKMFVIFKNIWFQKRSSE